MGFFASGLALLVLATMSHFQEGAAAIPICHKGWTYSNGYCYGYFLKALSWYEAEVRCQDYSRSGHLVSINNKLEAAVVIELLRGHKYFSVWLGLYGGRKEGWWWIDDSKPGYVGWGPGQPNFSAKLDYYCVQYSFIKGQWWWETVNCDSLLPYICKYPA